MYKERQGYFRVNKGNNYNNDDDDDDDDNNNNNNNNGNFISFSKFTTYNHKPHYL